MVSRKLAERYNEVSFSKEKILLEIKPQIYYTRIDKQHKRGVPMKKTNIILILIAMISLLGLGAVVLLFGDTSGTTEENPVGTLEDYQDNYIADSSRNKEIVVEVVENFSRAETAAELYNTDFQNSVRADIDALINANEYSEDNPLVIYNPFLTNAQSLYVYFQTEEAYAVSYSVHTPEADYDDFGAFTVPNRPDTSKIHEFQVIGLIPGETNMITIRLMDINGVVKIRRFYFYNENTVAASTIELKTEQGTKQVENEDKTFRTVPASGESVAEGLFVVFPAANEVAPYLRIYDNYGVQRCELPLETYGTRRLLVYEDFMFFRVSENKIVGINRLGQMVKCFTAEHYTFGEDYCLDKNNDILVLASDKRQASVDDCIILLDRESLEVTELVDFGDLLPEYKVMCKKTDGVQDWLSLNSISLVEGNRVLVSGDKDDIIIKIRRLYNDPRIAFIVGDSEPFRDTEYTSLFAQVDNEFELHHGLNMVEYQPYDLIRETRHYICLLHNNEDYEYEKRQDHYAYYYRYLVDDAEGGEEAQGSVRLIDSFILPEVGDSGSIQWYRDHLLFATDKAAEFYEYDSEFQLITKYTYEEPVIKKTEEEQEHEEDYPPADATVAFLRVAKHDFLGYYYTEKPVIIQPVETEIEGAEKGNE